MPSRKLVVGRVGKPEPGPRQDNLEVVLRKLRPQPTPRDRKRAQRAHASQAVAARFRQIDQDPEYLALWGKDK